MLTKRENEIHNLFEELVPSVGKCECKAGEIIRAYSRIGYRFFNDGDLIGIGYGKHTCNSAARFLIHNTNDEISGIVSKMWGEYDESEYEGLLNDLEEAVLKYVEENESLRTEETCDMFDYWEKDDEIDDEEEEDEYEDYWEDEEDW